MVVISLRPQRPRLVIRHLSFVIPMPYRALIITLATVTIALLAVGMWVRSIGPMLTEVNAATQASTEPGFSHPAAQPFDPTSGKPLPPDRQFKRVVKGTMILAFVLIGMLFVVGFFASLREWVRVRALALNKPAAKTPFVDAWKIAGERLQTPAADSDTDTDTDPPAGNPPENPS
jgi:hypothetical protein